MKRVKGKSNLFKNPFVQKGIFTLISFFFLFFFYSAQDAYEMGMVNAVIPHEELEQTAYDWAQEILEKSPISIKMLKFAMNLTDDGMVGQQVFAGEATRLAYMSEEAIEGRNSFLEKRKPNFEKKYIP